MVPLPSLATLNSSVCADNRPSDRLIEVKRSEVKRSEVKRSEVKRSEVKRSEAKRSEVKRSEAKRSSPTVDISLERDICSNVRGRQSSMINYRIISIGPATWKDERMAGMLV